MNGKIATRLRKLASELGLDYKTLKRNYKRLKTSDSDAMAKLRKIYDTKTD